MAPTELPAEGQHNEGAEHQEAKPAANETRAELSGNAVELGKAATERIALLEKFLDRVTAQFQQLGERVGGHDDADIRAHG